MGLGWGWLGLGWLARLGSGLALLRILAGFRLAVGWISGGFWLRLDLGLILAWLDLDLG